MSLPDLSAVAEFHLRRLKIKLTEAELLAFREQVASDATLFRYPYNVVPSADIVRLTLKGEDVLVHHYKPKNRIEEVHPAYPLNKTLISAGCAAVARGAGFDISRENLLRVLRQFETTTVRRHTGNGFYEGTVTLDGQNYEIAFATRGRAIVTIQPHLYRYVTKHAVERARERYDLIVDEEVARELHHRMVTGQYRRNSAGPGAGNNTIRATVHYDTEDFTVVFDPQTQTIVTVTPLGDFDPARKAAGA